MIASLRCLLGSGSPADIQDFKMQYVV